MNEIPITVNVLVKSHDKQPCIELRRLIIRSEMIKEIVSAAYHDKPIVILPKFNNKIQAVGALATKKIIYFNQDTQEYNFKI